MKFPFRRLQSLSRTARLLVGLASSVVLLNLIAVVLAWLSVQQGWNNAQGRTLVATQNLAQLLEHDITASFDRIDLVLRAVADEAGRRIAAKESDSGALNRFIDSQVARVPDLERLRVTNADGDVISGTGVTVSTRLNAGDRDYFARLRDNPGIGLVVSKPVIGNFSHKWVIVLARRIDGPDGRFAGIALAPVALQDLKTLFSGLNLGRNGAVSLRQTDLTLVVRHPGPLRQDDEEANRIVSKELAQVVHDNPVAGTYDAPTALDKVQRRNAYRKFAKYPFYIIVGLATEDYLGEWRHDIAQAAVLTLAFALVTLVLSWLTYRAWRRQEADMQVLTQVVGERRRAEDTLRESEESYRSIFDNMLNGIAHCRMLFDGGLPVDFIYLRVNEAFERHTGLKNVVGRRVSEVIPGLRESDPRLFEIYGRVAMTGQPERFETFVTALQMWFTVSAYSPMREYFVVVFDVITERKHAEEDLRIAATAFEAQEGMIVTDADNVILRVNRAFTDITGYSAADAVGRNPRFLQSGRQDAGFYAAMWESISLTGSWQGEIWNRRRNGDVYPEWLTITAVKDEAGHLTHYVATLTDITERKAAEAKIEHLAYYDALTHLPNRRLLLDRLQQALAASARNQRQGALLYIDLDDFKTLNDTRGHDVGDLLLVEVAARLLSCVREDDTVSRLGGDEFLVMLKDLSESALEAAGQAQNVGEKILATLGQRYILAGHECYSTPSIGITLFSNHQASVEELLKQADLAMYQAKTAGRNTMRFFDPAMQAVVTARAILEEDLREGVRHKQFLLHYQAQVDGEGRMTGAEALVRWLNPKRGLVPPAEFIPLAEETGLILPLGEWVLETACAQLVLWQSQPATSHLTLAVNVSARQFRQPTFVAGVLAVLERTGAPAQRLKLELTESLLLDDVEDTIAKMAALKGRGVGFSLDDFGTGYSSLAYLKRLPLDQLKIDQSFIRDVLTDANDAAIARTIVALAHSLGLSVIAEGVETVAQRDFLARHGCHAYQGYLFGRPGPAEALGR